MSSRTLHLLALVWCVAIMLAGCAKKRHVTNTAPRVTPSSSRNTASAQRRTSPAPQPPITSEEGIASWYGIPYHGRQAANGEIYDMEKMTAAHRTLPFGTWVRVTNLTNGKTTEVRITDRGPFIDGRIIDLSRAAAREIDLLIPGIVQVRVDVINPAAVTVASAPSWYAVQVALIPEREIAEQMRAQLVHEYGAAQIVIRDGRPPQWRVLVGREQTLEGARQLADRMQGKLGAGFVVRLDDLSAVTASASR